ncbi:MAG: rhomboid family intramembrane serine protease [Dehalococcoidales bacterium]|jgi:membrane associated rhomboid family serine protease|nr:rhomboid family intramembrane serine protease [Dehalococcoidales bacterium]MDD3265072.1 rhomboid family intramembrane serine protease [Dehalococcoidales bacterium]MDD4322951.1 rhomboid family intramembrane serine protease [Dehalococcoidales bacterium]MDD4794601.1 rhomboid family intramembrane serine protease [Dehalococcoidales bacterium]MDD5122548.1 rhomboid family intramembrane serine protease [Dehalococcoidales bacterium]
MNYQRSFNLRNLNPIIVILAINVLVFFAVRLFPDLIGYLGLWGRPLFVERPWGLITSVFTHYDLFHLFANMFTLYFFGNYVLRLVGVKKFALIYLAGGMLGGAFFVLLAPYSLAIGASGAVFALGGALAILVPNTKVIIFPIPIPMPLWVAVIGGFIILSFMSGVAWQAHLGGLLAGLVAGLIFKQTSRNYYF